MEDCSLFGRTKQEHVLTGSPHLHHTYVLAPGEAMPGMGLWYNRGHREEGDHEADQERKCDAEFTNIYRAM